MPKITFIQHDGEQQTVEAKAGSSAMKTALANTAQILSLGNNAPGLLF